MSATRDEARKAAKRFGEWLDHVLDRLTISKAELGRRTGVDPSTLDRICNGDTNPLFETALAIIKAVGSEDHKLCGALAGDLFELLTPPQEIEADYTGDGKVDRDDLVPAAAMIGRVASDLMMLTLEALADGQVTDMEWTKITQKHGELQQHSAAHELICKSERDRWARMRPRR